MPGSASGVRFSDARSGPWQEGRKSKPRSCPKPAERLSGGGLALVRDGHWQQVAECRRCRGPAIQGHDDRNHGLGGRRRRPRRAGLGDSPRPPRPGRLPGGGRLCGGTSTSSEAGSRWRATASAGANIATSPTTAGAGGEPADGFYAPLAAVANRWQAALGRPERFPAAHPAYLDRCRAAGQARPTPLLLRYGPGDYNCLHQDLYGAEAFPLQAAILLSRPGEDFTGGEFLLAEQRPRRQSRATVVPLEQGDAVVFAVSERPVRGSRGWYRTRMRHGVSTIRSGERFTLGLIFHDAS